MNGLLLAAASAWAASPEWSLSDGARTLLGWAVAGAGDVNGDGYADVIVGRPGAARPLEYQGQVDLYLGSAGGLGSAPAWGLVGERDKDFLGCEVAAAGDVNGDGYDDVLVGAVRCGGEPRESGCADLYLGSAAGLGERPAWSFRRDLGRDLYGQGLAGAGDVDGDGFGDILVAGTGRSSDIGTALLFRGGPQGPGATPDWQVDGERGDGFGFAVSGAGDVDGDGYGDVVVGSLRAGLQVWSGSPAGLGPEPSWSFRGDEASRRLGWSVAGAGDLNGDGFDDIVASDPSVDTPATRSTPTARAPDSRPARSGVGRALVFLGSVAGLGPEPAWSVEGSAGGEELGTSVAGVGDLDGDGFDDLAIGAPGLGTENRPTGAFAVFAGGPDGLAPGPALWVTGDGTERRLGASLASAGDVDGDGRDELVVGATGDAGYPVDGRVQLYGVDGRLRARTSMPSGLFAPTGDAPPPVDPWKRNEVLRDWPYACPGMGLHAPIQQMRIPRNRQVYGFTFAYDHTEPPCAEGKVTLVEPGQAPPGAMSPADALALWNTGTVEVDWCLADGDTWLADGPIATPARPDPGATAEWRFIGWSDAPMRHVKQCPWRQVLLVPVLLDVGTGDGALAGTLALWLVVSSDDPETWTLTPREAYGVEVGGALEQAWRARFGAPGIEPTTSYLWFHTDGTFGHRQLRLGLSPADDPALRAEVSGQWRWVARP